MLLTNQVGTTLAINECEAASPKPLKRYDPEWQTSVRTYSIIGGHEFNKNHCDECSQDGVSFGYLSSPAWGRCIDHCCFLLVATFANANAAAIDIQANAETRAENSGNVEPRGNRAISAVSPGASAGTGALINQRTSVASNMAYPSKPIVPKSAATSSTLKWGDQL